MEAVATPGAPGAAEGPRMCAPSRADQAAPPAAAWPRSALGSWSPGAVAMRATAHGGVRREARAVQVQTTASVTRAAAAAGRGRSLRLAAAGTADLPNLGIRVRAGRMERRVAAERAPMTSVPVVVVAAATTVVVAAAAAVAA